MSSATAQRKGPVTVGEVASRNGAKQSWITDFGIRAGEWFVGAKPQLKMLMRPTYQLKVRVYAAGLLHSVGFQDEMAWRQIRTREGTKKVPYTPRDIVADLNQATERYFRDAGVELTDAVRQVGTVTKQNVRRALASLESSGAAERRLKDGTPVRELPLETRKQLNHNVHLFFFCRPKPASEKQAKQLFELWESSIPGSSQRGQKVTTYGCLESISFALKVYNKLRCDYLLEELAADPKVVNLDYLRSQLEVVVEDYKKAHQVVDEDYKKRLEVVHSSPHIRKDRNTERIGESNSASEPVAADPKPTPDPPPSKPSSAIAVTDPDREREWDRFCLIMDACGKPVSVAMSAACRAEFFKYPLSVEQRIVEDAAIRAIEQWNKPMWTPAPLAHLRSQIWDKEPIKRRSLPTPATGRQQQLDEVMRQHRERTEARMKKSGAS